MNVTLYIGGNPITLEQVSRKTQELAFTLNGKKYTFRGNRLPDGSFQLEREIAAGVWQRMDALVWQSGKDHRVAVGNNEAKVSELAVDAAHGSGQAELSPPAPMPGLVRQILVKKGERVTQGQPLAVMEAMKLQITLSAGADATVKDVLVKVGDMVSEGATLVQLTADGAKDAA